MRPEDVVQLLQLLNEQEHIEKPFIQYLLNDARAQNEANDTFAKALSEFQKQSCTRHLAQYRYCFARVDAFLIHLLCVFQSDAFCYNRVQKAFFTNFGAKIRAYCVVTACFLAQNVLYGAFSSEERTKNLYENLWDVCVRLDKHNANN